MSAFCCASLDSADTDLADVFIVIDRGEQNLQRRIHILLRGGDLFENGVKNRLHVVFQLIRFIARLTVARRCVNDREVQLLVGCTELDEEFQRFIDYFVGACFRTIYFVDDHDAFFVQLQCFTQNKTRLRHAAFKSIHQQQNTIHHLQNALHLASEIGMTRCVNNIDACVAVKNGGILGKYRDTALPFKIAGVHDPFRTLLVAPKGAGILQKLIDQGGFAVIDVCNNRYITNVHTIPLYSKITLLYTDATLVARESIPIPSGFSRFLQGYKTSLKK